MRPRRSALVGSALLLFAMPVAAQLAVHDGVADDAAPSLTLSGTAGGERPWWERITVEEVSEDPVEGGDEGTVRPMQERVVSLVVPSDFSFETDSAELTSAGTEAIIGLLPQLRGAVRIVVSGCTDPRGSEAHNQALGLARAEASVVALAAHGVPAEVLVAESWGASHLTSRTQGQDEKEWLASNRRVVITVTTTKPDVPDVVDPA